MKLLYLEDSRVDAELTLWSLRRHLPEARVEQVATLAEARARLAQGACDILLSDLDLPDGGGLELVSEIRERGLPVAVVMLTGTGDADTVVAALKAGVDDYLIKGQAPGELLAPTLRAALERARRQRSSTPEVVRVIYAGADPAELAQVQRHFERHAPHFRLEAVRSNEDLARRIRHPLDQPCPCDVLLQECRGEGDTAIEGLRQLLAEGRLHVPVVMLGSEGDEPSTPATPCPRAGG